MRKLAVLAAAAAVIVITGACKKEGAAPPAAGGGRGRVQFPVDTITVQVRSLVYSVTAVGSVEAFEKVQVTARVPGVADRVLFSEGGFAAADQVLVEIETERYRLGVEAAQAAYEKSEASKADAEAGLKRRETVITQTPGLIPGEEVEAWRTKVLVAASEVAQMRSALNQAKLNLRDAFVRAPIAGIIQTRTVQTGQYVQTGTVLATLVRRDPLLLRFKVPERDAARIKPGQEARFRVREDSREFTAKVVHVAESADDVSRLVAVTANIDDPSDRTLRPGSFAEITVPVSSTREAAVIPVSAVRPSERGFIAFVVEGDNAVERILTLGMRSADGQVEVLSGLKVGEALVVRGSEALQNGVTVRMIAPGAAPAPAEKPADKQAPPAKKG
ncbi:MAG: efflux RND transporter periplasmic adaptor subunit [Acidobacteria bacterium]|nr:efflux RND transporter periplasmic adaptor subunit [Acidobacteriota bacterium]MBE3131774.1 efflux RND transporter periplasmic adaptor subunit [Acidobacteriota bacterium]